MGFEITDRARIAADKIAKEPNIVLKIDGVDTTFGSAIIKKFIRIGDADLYIDGTWTIGGFTALENQESNISIDSSTNSIKQQLDIDKGRGSSISSMEIALIDFDKVMTELITPGAVVEDILGRKAKVLLGFSENTAYPEDYFTIFRGIIDDVKAEQGVVKINLAHPDQKKKASIYQSSEHTLDGAINSSQTTITLDQVEQLLLPVLGPDMTYDPSFEQFVRIDDEIIKYTGISGLDLTGCVRGQLGTIAAAHDDEAGVNSFYTLEGNCIDLALKLMLSGWQDNFVEDVPVQHFNQLGDGTPVTNTIFFAQLDIEEEYGVVIGDYITTSGASNGANNVTLKVITNVDTTEEGSFVEVADVTFVTETDSAAVCAFRSQYDTLPSGLMMSGDEVDVAEHLNKKRLFLSSFDLRFYLKETIENGKEFLEQEIYKPSGGYSLPRKSRASLGFFIGPIPGAETIILDTDNITNPEKLKIRRSINKNFFNTIVYKYEVDALEDKFLRGVVTQSAASVTRIPVGTRAMLVESKGMRQDLLGSNNAQQTSTRRLNRFKYGSEFLEGVDVTYATGFTIEIGDILILDGEGLNLANTVDGTRDKPPKMFEVCNISKGIKKGKITIDLIDTGFDGSARYALFGPSSHIKSGISQTKFVIEGSYNSPFGINEYKKWNRYSLVAVKVRSEDGFTRFAQTHIASMIGNEITVATPLGFTPQPGDIMELANYDFAEVTQVIKLKYGHFAPLNGGADDPYQYI